MKPATGAHPVLPLSGLDGAFLHLETPETPMHVGSLHVFDLPAGYAGDFHADIKRLMARRLHMAPVFQRRLAPMPLQFANPVWVHDDEVDLDWHVQRLTLRAPGGQAELEDMVGHLHGEPLDRHRPLWRLYVLDGMPAGQAGYYIKVHHAVIDGQAGVMLAQALFDITPRPRAMPRPRRAAHQEPPGAVELAAAALKHDVGQYIKFVRHLPDVLRTLGGLLGVGGRADAAAPAKGAGLRQNFGFGPHTALNVPITGRRGFAGVSLPLEPLKTIAHAHDAKLNDVVMALAAGTLRRWLATHGGIPKKPLTAAMPISLRAPGNQEYTTQATMALVNLHSDIADPVRRLHAIRDASGAVKKLAGRAKGVLPTDFPSITLPWVLHGLASLYGRSGLAGAIPPIANVVISNVPGPQVPLYAAGARMRTYWPMSIVEHGVAVNLTVMSYAGALGFGFTTARDVVPDAGELSRALLEAFDELSALALAPARKPTTPRKRSSAWPADAPTSRRAPPKATAKKPAKTAATTAAAPRQRGAAAGPASPAAKTTARRPRARPAA